MTTASLCDALSVGTIIFFHWLWQGGSITGFDFVVNIDGQKERDVPPERTKRRWRLCSLGNGDGYHLSQTVLKLAPAHRPRALLGWLLRTAEATKRVNF